MNKIIITGLAFCSGMASAVEYETPGCYAQVPTSCSFDEMTLQLCNEEGKSKNLVFLLSQRMYMPGGNKFGNSDGSRVCVVKGINGADPKRYVVKIE
jgi:hypothetical protein